MNKLELNNYIKSDIYRYYGKNNLSFIEKLSMPYELKNIIFYRKAKYYIESNNIIIKSIYKINNRKRIKKYFFQVPYITKIGYGFYIGHLGSIIINGRTIIGNNCNIATGVVIGQENRGKREGTPVIGNDVWIGSNAVIVGNIKIGNNVLIAPNSYVNFDVPSNSIVLGNPATIYKNLKATDGYINNKYKENK